MATTNKPAVKGKDETPAIPAAELAIPVALSQEEQDELNEFLGVAGKEGKENIKPEDIVMPRIALLQALNPQVKERKGRAGDFFNIITEENYGEYVDLVPLLYYTSRIKWESPTPGSPIECIARDGENGTKYGACSNCPHKDFGQNAAGQTFQPSCTEFKNLIGIPLVDGVSPYDSPPAAFSVKRTGIGAMKQVLTRMQQMRYKGREVPIYSHTWRITPKEEKNEKGDYYIPAFEDQGMITDLQLLKYLRDMYTGLKGVVSKFSIPQEQEVEDVRPARDANVIDADFKPSAESAY